MADRAPTPPDLSGRALANPRHGRLADRADPARAFTPPFDMIETDHDIRIAVDLPGIAEEDIELAVEGRRLVLCGVKRSAAARNEHVLASSRRIGAFALRLPIPSAFDPSEISAGFDRGVLLIIVPKRRAAAIVPVVTGDAAIDARLSAGS